jgi:carbon storage regulator
MLVLSRKPGEKIMIGGGITLTVLEVIGNRIKLGVEAPSHVRVLRAELARERGETDPDLQAKPAEWQDAGPDLVVNR